MTIHRARATIKAFLKAPVEAMDTQAKTVGSLRETGYRSRSVKQEMRENLLAGLRTKTPLFPGIIGYDDTVIPQLINAILSKHDVLFLGLRGQAKSRLIRLLPSLLDEWMPSVAGSDLPDDPLDPMFPRHRRLLDEHGDDRHGIRSRGCQDNRATGGPAQPGFTGMGLLGPSHLLRGTLPGRRPAADAVEDRLAPRREPPGCSLIERNGTG